MKSNNQHKETKAQRMRFVTDLCIFVVNLLLKTGA